MLNIPPREDIFKSPANKNEANKHHDDDDNNDAEPHDHRSFRWCSLNWRQIFFREHKKTMVEFSALLLPQFVFGYDPTHILYLSTVGCFFDESRAYDRRNE